MLESSRFSLAVLWQPRQHRCFALTSHSPNPYALEQALEKWGNWGQIAPGVSNGQSEIKFTRLEFARPPAVAAQFDPDEGFTGLIQVP